MKLAQAIAILLLPIRVIGCGLGDWSPPISHFDQVDFQGHVHIVKRLGEVEGMPIYLIFNSSYGASPYAGAGFSIPILESKLVAVDEKRFQMTSPSGWLWVFQRTKDPSILEGNSGWKGQIISDIVSLWAPCGDKLVFKNGKIVSMQLKQDRFDYEYKGNRVDQILKNGQVVLEVGTQDKTGEMTSIKLPKNREEIAFQQTGSRPIIENIGGTTVVSRVDKTLGEVTKTNGSKESFYFSVDEKMNPELKTTMRKIVWDHSTRNVMRDGEWNYSIKSPENPGSNVSISRVNLENKKEEWFNDNIKGREVTQRLDGSRDVRSWFTSGILTGKQRSEVTSLSDGSIIMKKSWTYDELGNLLRISEFKSEKGTDIGIESEGTEIQRSLHGVNSNTVEWRSQGKVIHGKIAVDKKIVKIDFGNKVAVYQLSEK